MTLRPRYTETHCAKGHELTQENTIIRKSGGIRCRTCAIRTQMNSKYGKGAADHYDRKMIEQEGCCILCKNYFGDKLCLDHDHATGEWRELICKFCNLLLGWVETRYDILKEAEIYLIRHQKEDLI